MILRSRSSSDLQSRNGTEDRDHSESRQPPASPSHRHEEDEDVCEPDGPVQVELPVGVSKGAELPVDPAPLVNGASDGHSSEDSNNEVDEFYTLLDTTLHLPEPSPRPTPGGEGPPQPKTVFTEGTESKLYINAASR